MRMTAMQSSIQTLHFKEKKRPPQYQTSKRKSKRERGHNNEQQTRPLTHSFINKTKGTEHAAYSEYIGNGQQRGRPGHHRKQQSSKTAKTGIRQFHIGALSISKHTNCSPLRPITSSTRSHVP